MIVRDVFAGVCNPKGGYDKKQSLPVNVSVAGPLLSRFDIVLILEDRKVNDRYESKLSTHMPTFNLQ